MGLSTDQLAAIVARSAGANRKDGKSGTGAVLDSGAEMHVSGMIDDFVSVSPYPNVTMSGVDGPVNGGAPCALRGVLKGNNLRIGSAAYYPPLGQERLLSTKLMVADGWEVSLKKANSRIHNARLNLNYAVDVDGRLPRVHFRVYGKTTPFVREETPGAKRPRQEWNADEAEDCETRVLTTKIDYASEYADEDKDEEVPEKLPSAPPRKKKK